MRPLPVLAGFLCAALLACVCGQARAGDASASFGVSVRVVGPPMPPIDYPIPAQGRPLPGGFWAVEGSIATTATRMRASHPEWKWDEVQRTAQVWEAFAHDQARRCVRLLARAVEGQEMVRLKARPCVSDSTNQ